MKKEKKILSLNGTTYTIVTGARWYVEYYKLHPAGVRERIRAYGQLNRIKNLAAREEAAITLIKKIAGTKLLQRTLDAHKVIFRKKTYQTYCSRLDAFYDWLGDRDELTLTVADANAFIRHSLATKAAGTVRGYRRTLSSLYNKSLCDVNPFEKSYQPPKQYKSLYYFKDKDIEVLKKHLSKYLPDVWFAAQLLFYCFIRPGEMRLLEIPDINLQDGFIELRPEVSKNKKAQKVSIPLHFIPVIEKYIGSRRDGLVFVNDKGKNIGMNYLNKRHSEALKELGISGRYAFYSWKHTGAVKAVKAGINLKDLQMQLRHHSLDMVNEYLKNLGVMDSEDLKKKFPVL